MAEQTVPTGVIHVDSSVDHALVRHLVAETSLAARLGLYLASAAQRGAFAWATNHCCHFAAGWVREREGLDALPLVPTPDGMAAWRLIASYGGLAEAITQQLGRAPIAPAAAQLGDVVLLPIDGEPGGRASVGLCNGRTSFFLDEHGCVQIAPTLQCTHAWRIDEAGSARPRSLGSGPALATPQTSAP